MLNHFTVIIIRSFFAFFCGGLFCFFFREYANISQHPDWDHLRNPFMHL